MIVKSYQEYSNHLDRIMKYRIYGTKGKVCYVFPSFNGRYFDYENFGMTDMLKSYIEEERLILVCVDGMDGESWANRTGDNRKRIEMQEKWFRYVTLELYPSINKKVNNTKKAIVTGCSMGGFHAGLFFFRRPDLFDTVISLSGLYEASSFFGNYMDDLVYNNSPVDFLRNMPEDHPYMKLYNESAIILCVGQGAWEEQLLASTRKIDALLKKKGIKAWVDYWGYDVIHDWCWWKKQIVYFMDIVLNGKYPIT